MQEDEQKARVLEESIARWAEGRGPCSGDTGESRWIGQGLMVWARGHFWSPLHQGWAGVTVWTIPCAPVRVTQHLASSCS